MHVVHDKTLPFSEQQLNLCLTCPRLETRRLPLPHPALPCPNLPSHPALASHTAIPASPCSAPEALQAGPASPVGC